MYFYDWLVKKYSDDDGMKGVIARFLKDKLAVKWLGTEAIRSFMVISKASVSCLEVFDECCEEYAREKD